MSTEQCNPYQSPLVKSEPIRVERRRRPWLPIALVALGTCAYLVFTALLVMSPGAGDRKAGYLFLSNTPVLALWIAGLVRGDGRSPLAGFAAAGMQFLILVMMIVARIGDFDSVCQINGVIIVSMSLLASICWVFAWQNRVPQSRPASGHG